MFVLLEAVARRRQRILRILTAALTRRNINLGERRVVEAIADKLHRHTVMLLLKRLLLVAVLDLQRVVDVQQIFARHVVPSVSAQLMLEAGRLRLLRLLLNVKEIHFGSRQVYHIVTRLLALFIVNIAGWRRANHERFARWRLALGYEAKTADGIVEALITDFSGSLAVIDEALVNRSIPRVGRLSGLVLDVAEHTRIIFRTVFDCVLSLQSLAAGRRLF